MLYGWSKAMILKILHLGSEYVLLILKWKDLVCSQAHANLIFFTCDHILSWLVWYISTKTVPMHLKYILVSNKKMDLCLYFPSFNFANTVRILFRSIYMSQIPILKNGWSLNLIHSKRRADRGTHNVLLMPSTFSYVYLKKHFNS